MQGRIWLVIGAAMGALGVALGAFGAHALETAVARLASTPDEQQRLLAIWETAVRYQMYHALAIVAVGLLARSHRSRLLSAAAVLFLFGILIFSGLLYALVLTGIKLFGAIVPIGGMAFIVGWILLAVAGWKQAATPTERPVGQAGTPY